MSDSRNPLLPYLALIALALIWGGSFLFIKVAVHDMSPEALLLSRSAFGLVTLAVLVTAMGRPLFAPGWRDRLVSFAIMAVTNAVIPWIAIAWGEERIATGLASILNATTTLWTAVLIYWVVPSERPSALNYAGVLLGLAGVVVLVYPDLAAHGISGSFLGAMAVVFAAVSYAINALYQRRKMRGVSVFEISVGQLAATVLFAIPIAAPTISHVHIQLASAASVIALGAGGTGIAYLLYYYVMNSLGAVRAAGVTFLVPITAVFWGALLLGERFSVPAIIGMIVILFGVLLTNVRRLPRRGRASSQAADSAAA
ncbi:MAG TPA: DMT family transporter [Candidatus Dormibacteraeota bacterium]|nr:DMT family transporter [Candidatus Dormibacteraeota bacterium]